MYSYHMIQALEFLTLTQRNWKLMNLRSHKNLDVDVYRIFIHIYQNLEATKMDFSRIHLDIGILFSAKKK